MAIRVLERDAELLTELESEGFRYERDYMPRELKSSKSTEFGCSQQSITGSARLIDALEPVFAWLIFKCASGAHPPEAIKQGGIAPHPRQLSEQELLHSWESYLHRHLDELKGRFWGKYVAIWNDEVIDSDDDLATLAERVYATIGYRPIFMPYIGDEDQLYEFTSPL